MSDSVFNEKEDYLVRAREEVQKRDKLAAELDKMRSQSKKLSKSIASEEKSIADEIAQTVKKRRQEIADAYDDRLDDNRSRKKSVSNKRDKKKNQRMNERIHDETKGTRDKIKELNDEMKTLLKRDKVSSFVSSKLFFTMFMPRGLGEIGGMLLSIAVYFIGVPSLCTVLVRNSLKNKEGINLAFWSVLVFSLAVVLLGIIYFAVYNATKLRHHDTVKQARRIQDQIKSNKRQAKDIRNSISKDKDESMYKLDAYDEKLANLEAEADSISEEKKEKLRAFEEETKQEIINEINDRRLQAVDEMKEEKKVLEGQIGETEKRYSELVLQISNQYAPYLGEDLCKEDKLADLISFMEEGRAKTVSEAISIYRGTKSSK